MAQINQPLTPPATGSDGLGSAGYVNLETWIGLRQTLLDARARAAVELAQKPGLFKKTPRPLPAPPAVEPELAVGTDSGIKDDPDIGANAELEPDPDIDLDLDAELDPDIGADADIEPQVDTVGFTPIAEVEPPIDADLGDVPDDAVEDDAETRPDLASLLAAIPFVNADGELPALVPKGQWPTGNNTPGPVAVEPDPDADTEPQSDTVGFTPAATVGPLVDPDPGEVSGDPETQPDLASLLAAVPFVNADGELLVLVPEGQWPAGNNTLSALHEDPDLDAYADPEPDLDTDIYSEPDPDTELVPDIEADADADIQGDTDSATPAVPVGPLVVPAPRPTAPRKRRGPVRVMVMVAVAVALGVGGVIAVQRLVATQPKATTSPTVVPSPSALPVVRGLTRDTVDGLAAAANLGRGLVVEAAKAGITDPTVDQLAQACALAGPTARGANRMDVLGLWDKIGRLSAKVAALIEAAKPTAPPPATALPEVEPSATSDPPASNSGGGRRPTQQTQPTDPAPAAPAEPDPAPPPQTGSVTAINPGSITAANGTVSVTMTVYTSGPCGVSVTVTVNGKTVQASGPGTVNGQASYSASVSGIPPGPVTVTANANGLTGTGTVTMY